MIFDTHAHLDDRAFDTDRAALLSQLPGLGLALVMNPGCSLASSRARPRWQKIITMSMPPSAPTRTRRMR